MTLASTAAGRLPQKAEVLVKPRSSCTKNLSGTIFQLSHKGVPHVNALILGNFFEYRHKSYLYIANNWAKFLSQTVDR